MEISLVCSTRDNLKYLKWSYDSVRKNQGNHKVWFCVGIDHCTDGTQGWLEEIKKTDPLVKTLENKTGQRLGHTVMYDKIVYELVETDLAMIWHSDMYLCPNALDSIEELMYKHRIPKYSLGYEDLSKFGYVPCNYTFEEIADLKSKGHYVQAASGSSSTGGIFFVSKESIQNKNQIVSLTRIEPPLHPSGPEKIVKDFGTEPENFKEAELLDFVEKTKSGKPTNGVFAPWCFWVDEFKELGGHDWLFRPQSKEDSSFFNRFQLKFGKNCFKQTWKGFVYHLTCRGSRFNPNLTLVGQNSAEWEEHNIKSHRNFIRMWGSSVKHDEFLCPIVPHKYNIGIVLKNPTNHLIYTLEPWCDKLDLVGEPAKVKTLKDNYILEEQPNTTFDLTDKINSSKPSKLPDIIIEVDGNRFFQEDMFYLSNISEILTDSGEIGEMQIGNLKLNIARLTHYEMNLITANNEKIELE